MAEPEIMVKKAQPPRKITDKDVGIAAAVGVGIGVAVYFGLKSQAPPEEPVCTEGASKCVGATEDKKGDLYICEKGKWVLKEEQSDSCPAQPPTNPEDQWLEIWNKTLPLIPIGSGGTTGWQVIFSEPIPEVPVGSGGTTGWRVVGTYDLPLVPVGGGIQTGWTVIGNYALARVPVGAGGEPGGPYIDILGVTGPSTATYGEMVNLNVSIKNNSGYSVYAILTAPAVGYEGNVSTLEPTTYSWPVRFQMPNKTIDVVIYSWYWSNNKWVQSDSVTKRITLGLT